MKKKRSPLAIIIILVVAALLVTGGFMFYEYSTSHSYVATINGEKITMPEFKFFLRIVQNDYETTAGVDYKEDSAKKDFWKTTKIEGENAEVKAKNETLEELKVFKILLINAKASKVQLDETEQKNIQASIDELVEKEGKGNKSAASASIKKKYGVSLSDYEKIYKDYMLAYGKYANSLNEKVNPTDKDIKDYYESNKSKFSEILLKNIRIDKVDPGTNMPYSEEKLADQKKLADEIYQKAKAGSNFEELVKQYSEDTQTKDSGGDLKVARDDTGLDQKVRDWAVGAKDGDLGLVEAANGFYILKYSRKLTYDDVKADAKEAYKSDQVTKQIDAWKKEAKYNIQRNQKAIDSVGLPLK